MNVLFQRPEDESNVAHFNASVFPERGEINEKLMKMRYGNPLHPESDISANVLALDDDGSVIGQALYHKTDFYYEGQNGKSEWGFDFFVKPEKRNEMPGIHILEFVKKHKPSVFATGLGEKALKIQKMFGYYIIGELKKYVRIVHPLLLPTGLLRAKNLKAGAYPNQVSVNGKTFKRLSISELSDPKSAYNTQLLEFARDRTFKSWRFFSPDFNYAFYEERSSSEKPIFFALRTVKIKGITGMVLADFRYDVTKPDEFRDILRAVKKIAARLLVPIVATGSSHISSDEILEASGFKTVGRHRPIVATDPVYKSKKQEIANRNFCFVTLADSDGEYLM